MSKLLKKDLGTQLGRVAWGLAALIFVLTCGIWFINNVSFATTDTNTTAFNNKIKFRQGWTVGESLTYGMSKTGAASALSLTLPSTVGGFVRTGQKYIVSTILGSAVTASGWDTHNTDATAAASGEATLAANLSTKVLNIPIPVLKVGDIITGYRLIGRMTWASGTDAATLDADLRKVTQTAAASTDAAASATSTITQISKTANFLLTTAEANSTVALTIAADTSYYLRVTGTTGATSPSIALTGVEYTVTEK